MHELSVCRALLQQVDAIASEHGASAVRKITLRIGPLSGVETALLREAFPAASAGTVSAGAELRIETPAPRVRCTDCGKETDAVLNKLCCARCGSARTRLLSGDELLLVDVVLAQAQEETSDV